MKLLVAVPEAEKVMGSTGAIGEEVIISVPDEVGLSIPCPP
jgi:hypothetical protein